MKNSIEQDRGNMTLIKCPECGKEISDKSDKCIGCGFPLAGSEIPFGSRVESEGTASADRQSRGFYLFSIESNKVNLECRDCGKVFRFDRELFEEVSSTGCVAKDAIKCPNCLNFVESGKVLSPKDYKKSSTNNESEESGEQAEDSAVQGKSSKNEKDGKGMSTVAAIALALLILFGLGSCVGMCSGGAPSASSSSSSVSSKSKDNQAVDEASKYSYDKYGHLQKES